MTSSPKGHATEVAIIRRGRRPRFALAIPAVRCTKTQAAIPARYPAVELASALLVAGCVWKFGLHPEALVAAFFCLALVAVSAIDIEHGIIRLLLCTMA